MQTVKTLTTATTEDVESPSDCVRPSRRPMRHAGRLLEVVAIACALVALIAVSASVAVAFGGHDKAAPPAAKPEPVYGIPAYDPLITRFGVDSGCGKWPEPLVMRYGNCFEPTSPTTSAN